jgi:hypothetical protein
MSIFLVISVSQLGLSALSLVIPEVMYFTSSFFMHSKGSVHGSQPWKMVNGLEMELFVQQYVLLCGLTILFIGQRSHHYHRLDNYCLLLEYNTYSYPQFDQLFL